MGGQFAPEDPGCGCLVWLKIQLQTHPSVTLGSIRGETEQERGLTDIINTLNLSITMCSSGYHIANSPFIDKLHT